MSRVGRNPITVPSGVTVTVDGPLVAVKGPKGQLSRAVSPDMIISVSEGQIAVSRPADDPRNRSLHGLTRTLIANMVQGVTQGFERRLELQGVGYRAAKNGRNLTLTVGYSHPVEIHPGEGIEFDVPQPTVVIVKGTDREAVGEVAAKIRSVRPPEPYQGKGIRYQGEVVKKKVGKTGKK